MKKTITLLTAMVLVLSLCACSKKVERSSWQEQYELGTHCLSEGKYEEAIPAFITAIEIDPKRVEAYEKLAEAYNALNDTVAAMETLRDGFIATGDIRLHAAITEITVLESASSQEQPQEQPPEPTPAATPISRSDLYPIDYIGMTIDSLAQLWGADYQTSEYFYAGGARPIYYEDGRTMMVFYIQDTYDDDYGVSGDDEIMLISVPETIDEIAPGIPTRASYLKLWGLHYKGDLWEGGEDEGEGETATYTIGYSREISIQYYWYDHKDPRENQADSVEIWKKPTPTQTIHTVDFQIEDGVLVKYTGPGGAVTIPDGVTTIRGRSSIGQYDGAFSGRTTVTSVAIPDGVFSIGEWAFYNCMLSSIVIPDSVMDIGEYAFGSCYFLSSVKIPNGLTKIEPYTFSGCSGLKSVTISDSVTDIGRGAFHGCSNLSSITIPKGVTRMNGMPFSGCDNLKSFAVDADNSAFAAQDGVLFNKKLTELIRYPTGKGLSHYSVPSGTTNIGVAAFEDCANLTNITIPDSVIRIACVFSGCDNLKSFAVDANNSAFAAQDGVLFNKKLTELIRYPVGKGSSHYSVPGGTTYIGVAAFDGCPNLANITIPNSVIRIGEGAFDGCIALTDVYYLGTQEEWAAIDIGFFGDYNPLQNATIHFSN